MRGTSVLRLGCSGQTCKSEQVLDGEPGDADGFHHGQLGIVGRVAVLVDDADRGDGVDRHGGRRQHHERDGDDAHDLERQK